MTEANWEVLHQQRKWGTCPEPAMARFIMRHFGLSSRCDVHVLDIGCGVGAQTFWLWREGFEADGVDCSEAAVKRANTLAAEQSFVPAFRVADATELPWQLPKFDAVIDVCCLQHLTNKEAEVAMKNIYRVLKPGGWFFSMMARLNHSSEAFGPVYARSTSVSGIRSLCDHGGLRLASVNKSDFTDNRMTIAHWIIEAQKPLP